MSSFHRGNVIVTKHCLAAASLLPLIACGTSAPADDTPDTGSISLTISSSSPTEPTGGSEGAETAGSATSPDASAGSEDEVGDEGPKFDVNAGEFCVTNGPGIHCDESTAISCAPDGQSTGAENCLPDICLPGTGCVDCLPGQFTCMGDKVMTCNANVWNVLEVCDPAAGEGCDLELGACAVLQPEGGTTPTGEYYQFADFQQGASGFLGGYDVDSYGDRLFVLGYSNAVDVYTVELLDSDADGMLEANQHPDNPENTGPIEARVLTHVETLPVFGTPSLSVSEIYALEDRVYIAGSQITELVLATGATQVIATPPGWASYFSHVGYDELRGAWYASNEQARRVFQQDQNTGTWGLAFLYPELAGDHMDGLEVVIDPETSIAYVYVSDMTSDFIAQYRLDPEMGWTQVNLFSYTGTAGVVLEGMGYGALYHFWASAGSSVYELGGPDLAQFLEPPG